MKYVLVYRERDNGYNWSVRNSQGLYAAWIGHRTGKTHIRGWETAKEASDYVDKHMAADCVWAPWPDEKPTPIKPVTTAASYKPEHGGYPDPEGTAKPRFVGQEIDRMAAGWASMGTVTARFSMADKLRSQPHSFTRDSVAHQPLVWPTIPQVDDGSNEEASTVPDALVQSVAHRVFAARFVQLLNNLRRY